MTSTGIPPLLVDDLRIEAHDIPVVVIWGNLELSWFYSLAAANAALIAEFYLNRSDRSNGARVFAWDGTAWSQMIL